MNSHWHQYPDCLYLAANQLTVLPDDFFGELPKLEWLDLRDNQLISIPSSFLGRHKCLKTLLLENNKLHTLPLELGLLTTLTGLNIRGNPLEFPPLEVRNKGMRMVLTFLKAVLEAKLSGQPEPTDGFQVGHSADSESSESENTLNLNPCLSKFAQQQQANQQPLRVSDSDGLVGPVPLSAALHKPASYYQLKQIHMDRLKKSASVRSPGQSAKKAARKTRKKLMVNGELAGGDLEASWEGTEQNYVEQRRMLQMKDLREKQDMILHRRKEKELLKEWQNEGRRLQRNKHMDKLVNGTIDYQPVAEHAPFAVDKEQMHMMTNEERIAQDIRTKHETLRRSMSPGTKHQMEEARSARDLELERRIKLHTTMMKERRQRPKGTPQEEMEAAKQELEMAEQLQREIEQRRKDVEYRFTAFVSDQVNTACKPGGGPPNQNYH
ncbi:hypothetical protein LSAT2_015636 [Lamellibrachia satsuma]|nr:hypothetical protein LSAT2_015636 [Lamellibrachia satsuma]